MAPTDYSNIQALNTRYQPYARRIVEIADGIAQAARVRCRITNSLRSGAAQDALYAKGRTEAGSIVTYVRGGESWHNYGLAVDIGIFTDGFSSYLSSSDLYREIGKEILATHDLQEIFWGGLFPSVFGGTFIDLPHYEWHPGYEVKGGAAVLKPYLDNLAGIPLYPMRQPPIDVTTPIPPSSPGSAMMTAGILVGSPDWMELKALFEDEHNIRLVDIDNEEKLSDLRSSQYAILRKYDPTF